MNISRSNGLYIPLTLTLYDILIHYIAAILYFLQISIKQVASKREYKSYLIGILQLYRINICHSYNISTKKVQENTRLSIDTRRYIFLYFFPRNYKQALSQL